MINNKKALSLKDLNELVAEVVHLQLHNTYWLEAELSQVNESRGHCYMEFIQKEETSNNIVARAAGRCWANKWLNIKAYFERITGQNIHAGMKIMVQVSAQFHVQYGFSWIIEDINPEYTLGDIMRRRNEIIAQLRAEGVFDLQKELYLSTFASRIAVISSRTAAGYGDFCNQLLNNDYGFSFHIELFQSAMQGERVEHDIIACLNDINDRQDEFDCVVIIRGGGATADLSCFDTLLLAENIANFPLPIITGIGHERDESVIDLVSFLKVKTPTAAAAFLIDRLNGTLSRILKAEESIHKNVYDRLKYEHTRINNLANRVPLLFSLVKTQQEKHLNMLLQKMINLMLTYIYAEQNKIDAYYSSLLSNVQHFLLNSKYNIELIEQRLKSVDPKRLLQRGYSITLCNGRLITDINQIKEDDVLTTTLFHGKVKSIVKKKHLNEKDKL